MNKKIFCAVLFALAVLSSTLAADQDFSITVPEGWNRNNESKALAQYQSDKGALIIVAETMPSDAAAPDAYMELVRKKFMETFKNCVFEETVAGKKGAHDSRRMKLSIAMYGMKMKYDVLYVFKGNKAYSLTGCALESNADSKYLADIKTFFDSFTLQ